jgi:hypothetical protein
MNLKFAVSEKKTGNKGSVRTLVAYLEKENKGKDLIDQEFFFNHHREMIFASEVIQKIDSNNRKLGKEDSKFFMLVLSPSEIELRFLNSSKKALIDYTRKVMDAYAKNYNKGITGDDLLYFAKLERNRYTRKKEIREGLNTHIHVIVSRRDINQKFKLSPMTNHKESNSGAVKSGFSRKKLMQESEFIFDKSFNYPRTKEESWEFQFNKKHNVQMESTIEKSVKPAIKKSKGNELTF